MIKGIFTNTHKKMAAEFLYYIFGERCYILYTYQFLDCSKMNPFVGFQDL